MKSAPTDPACGRSRKGLGDCRSPSYQSAFYQISDANEAWYQITFVGSQATARNEAGSAPATALYACRLDGSGVRRLTFNLSSDYDPHLLWDGRLVFASWQRRTLEYGPWGRVVLAGSEPGGHRPGAAVRGRRPAGQAHGVRHEPGDGWCLWKPTVSRGTGRGCCPASATRRPLHTYRPLTAAADGLFHSPSPLPDGRILVSRRPADGSGTHGVYRFDPASKQIEAVFDAPEYHEIQAQRIAPRREPDGRSSPEIDTDPHGKLYCLNVYATEFKDKSWLPPGTVKVLRLVEGVPPRAEQGARNSSRAVPPPLAPRRILGEVPVAPDGSFNVQVPADTPVELQLLDEDGLALRSCGWVWTHNHFNQGCLGCHEDPERTPENLVVSALEHPSVVVAPPLEQRRSIDFQRDLLPVMAQKCLPCHARGGSPPDLTAGGPVPATAADAAFARSVYEVLLEPAAGGESHGRGKYVDPGRRGPAPWSGICWERTRPARGTEKRRRGNRNRFRRMPSCRSPRRKRGWSSSGSTWEHPGPPRRYRRTSRLEWRHEAHPAGGQHRPGVRFCGASGGTATAGVCRRDRQGRDHIPAQLRRRQDGQHRQGLGRWRDVLRLRRRRLAGHLPVQRPLQPGHLQQSRAEPARQAPQHAVPEQPRRHVHRRDGEGGRGGHGILRSAARPPISTTTATWTCSAVLRSRRVLPQQRRRHVHGHLASSPAWTIRAGACRRCGSTTTATACWTCTW